MINLMLAIDGSAIITTLIESSPFTAIGALFGWYMYKQNESKDAALIESEKAKSVLVERLIDDKEKRIISEQQQMTLLEKIIDKTGDIPVILKEGITRLEKNQGELKDDLKELKNIIK